MAAIGASQWLRMTKESTWGVFDGSAITANIFWIRLTEGNSFSAEPSPGTWDVRGADGFNLRQQRGSPTTFFPFSLKTVMYPAQAAKLVAWGLVPTANVLDSYTIDFWDGIEVRRLLGARVESGSFGTNSKDYVMQFQVSGYGQNYGTPPSLTQPASTVFVNERPYVHQDSAGVSLFGATTSTPVLVMYDSIEVTWKNVLDHRSFESQFIQICDYNGRDVDASLGRLLTANTERINYQAQNPRAALFKWQVLLANGYSADHSIQVSLNANTYDVGRSVSRDFSRDQDETLNLSAYKDGAVGSDIVCTVS